MTRSLPLGLKGHSGLINAIALNGHYIVSTSSDSTMKLWNRRSGQCIATFSADAALSKCAWSPDGKIVIAGDGGGGVHFLRAINLP